MSQHQTTVFDRVRVIPREHHRDSRGWLLKIFSGAEPDLERGVAEVYLVMALPGEVRGNHYHEQTSEWFTLIQGQAELLLADARSGKRQILQLSGDTPVTVYVPCGIGHVFVNPTAAAGPMLLVAYADRPYDPTDTIPMVLI